MASCGFDTLLYGLREAVCAADESLGARRQALRRDDEKHALHAWVPVSPAADAELEPVVIPLRMFRDNRRPHISVMSIEFEGRFLLRRERGVSKPRLVIEIGKPRFRWFSRGGMHHVRISYRSADAWQPCVEVDGKVVDLPPPAMAGNGS
ncbi:hypothetical protein J2T07_003197 [Luteibacter jiangsuensis]|uniref:Uncharacterized protein n=1 Tax=Luteibacter jiangsuensis TaxID=637577 RepID=A0ABT9T141_9GAMM|nr:hypothetical protein [Luteibacter jiangsuensis]MDQ0010991.1 hypothetical protein [Luteibacter jiangsuensis]